MPVREELLNPEGAERILSRRHLSSSGADSRLLTTPRGL